MLARNRQLVGLDIGSAAVKVVELRKGRGGGYELLSAGMERLPADAGADGAPISNAVAADSIRKVFRDHGIRNRRTASSLSGHSVIVKKVTVPLQTHEELDESLQWEAEQYIPFVISDVHLDYHIVRENRADASMDIILVAVKKDKIADQTSLISMAGKVASVIDVDAFALHNAYELNYRPEPGAGVLLLNIGAGTMTVSIAKGSELVFTRDITIGTNHYSDFLCKEMQVTREDAERMQQGAFRDIEEQQQAEKILSTVTEILALEIRKTLDYFRDTSPSVELQIAYVAGGGCHVAGLREHFEQRLKLPVEPFDAFRAVRQFPEKLRRQDLEKIAPDMAVAVGLSLREVREARGNQ